VRRRALLGLLACGAAAALPGCGAFGRDLPDYRYRLTVEVETPEGLKTGSSVIEVRTALADKALLPDANTLDIQFTGEAAAVDLGSRGVLFALLRSDTNPGWAGGAMELVTPHPGEGAGADRYARWHARMVANTGLHELPRNSPSRHRKFDPPIKPGDPPSDYPMLVRFRNMADPMSVEKVDPDDLTASFGKGVKLKRITVQLTDDAVTTGIEKRLGWLAASADGGLDPMMGVTAQPTLAQRLGFLDFRRN
jgi:hypothetical protein